MNLDFIQSNWLRQYPFRANQGILDINGNSLPTSILVGLRISCTSADLELYINKIVINNGQIGISFAGLVGNIGYANAVISEDNQYIPIIKYSGGVIGSVLVGDCTALAIKQIYIFDNTNGLIEPSTVIVIPTPTVTSIDIKGIKYTGNVNIASKTVNITNSGVISLFVKNPTNIKSRGDKQAKHLTCNNNIISGINTVIPDANGNIDVYTIAPLHTTNDDEHNIINITATSLSMDETSTEAGNLCKLINTPVSDTTDTYTDLLTTTNPEWKSWPQYQAP